MKNLVLAIIALLSISVFGQKKLKIKGNREVTEIYRSIEPFYQIEISDGLEVTLTQSTDVGYTLKADSNLLEVVKLEVVDSVLKIYATNRIVSSKKLEISLTFVSVDRININKDSKINGQNNFKLNDLTINSLEGSHFDLDIDAEDVLLLMNGNSKGNLILKSNQATMTLNDNAFLKGGFSIDKLNLNINDRADMNIEGNSDELNLVSTGSTDIKAKKLKATNISINASNTSDIYIYASKYLSIYAKGRSYIYVYGNPEIKVEGLNGKSQIIKK
jgi:hypothetical protein